MRTTRLFTALCLLLAFQAPALAGTVTVMISGGFSPAYAKLVDDYQKRSGDMVVTLGQNSLKDGAKVAVVNTTPAKAMAAQQGKPTPSV